MADEHDLVARLRATGQGTFGSAMRGASSQVRGVGKAGAEAGAHASRSAGSGLRQLSAIAGGLTIASAFRAAAMAGVQFNQMQDSQRVGFTVLLKSGTRATKMMRDIQALALKSPVLDPGTTGDSVRLLAAYGLQVKDTLRFTEALGDMSAATGRSIQETLPRGAMALGQIASKGRLQMEEMNQLAESVGLSQKAVRTQLGMSRKEFADTFTPGNAISSTRALPAILAAMRAQSKGAAELLSKTPGGQIQAAKERGKIIAGSITRPIYDRFGQAAGDLSKQLQGIWTTKTGKPTGGSLDAKLGLTAAATKRVLNPLRREFVSFWHEHHLGQRLSDAVDEATPKVLDAMGTLGQKATGAFVRAWWHAGPWGKLVTAAFLASKLGAFRIAGGMAADLFVGRFSKRAAGSTAAWRAVGRHAGIAMAAGMAVALGLGIGEWLKAHHVPEWLAKKITGIDPKKTARDERRNTRNLKHDTALLTDKGETGYVYNPATKRNEPVKGRRITRQINLNDVAAGRSRGSVLPPPSIHLEVPVKIGERELGRAIAKIGADNLSRGG
jgi:tape measure domain-containing protein